MKKTEVKIMSSEEMKNDPEVQAYERDAAEGLLGTQMLSDDERLLVARARFEKAASAFAENPSADNWRKLNVAMCALQSADR